MRNAEGTMHNCDAVRQITCHSEGAERVEESQRGTDSSPAAQNDRGSIETAEEILQKLALWVKAQEADKLSVQNLKHATGVLKDLREILKSDAPDKPVEIKVEIGNEEYAQ